MTISIIADLLIVIVYAFLLICMLGYILFLIFKPGEPLLPEEQTNEKLDEIIDVLHCIASDKVDREAMKDIQTYEDDTK